jgi:hypothetical protein
MVALTIHGALPINRRFERTMPVRVFLLSEAVTLVLDQSVKAWALARLGHGRTVALGALTLRVVLHRRPGARPRERRVALVTLWIALAATFGALVHGPRDGRGVVAGRRGLNPAGAADQVMNGG